MKAISLWQPWASAIALGSKRIETRSWTTDYRGQILIHASKRHVKSEMAALLHHPQWRGALSALAPTPAERIKAMPFGALVAIAELVACVPTEDLINDETHGDLAATSGGTPGCDAWCEWDMGDYGDGRFGWVLEHVQALPSPISWPGQRGIFYVPDYVLELSKACRVAGGAR